MIYPIISIILILVNYSLYSDNKRLRVNYANELKKDDDLKNFILNIFQHSHNKQECVKEVNKKYKIGILNSKILVDEVISNKK